MLVHLSTTSPYICDISLGPIEQANRMSKAPRKKSLLELKESFPKLQPIRTPLKLLAPDEVPMDTSIATTTTTDNNTSRQTSLQPVWYTEQTIVDDNNLEQQQQRNSTKSPNHRLDLTRSTLPPIESNSPEIEDDIIVKEPLSTKTSLMRKSSTFTIEPQTSISIPSALNDSEKENDLNHIMTSTQQDPKPHPTEPSDESFRQLEHLLGLGSANTNLTMTTTAQESPKSNHESLSLTMVTPTEIINQTTNSLHLSYAPAGGGSLPSSQNILLMPTIESITEPSMNSTIPPPFAVDNSDTEEDEEQPSSTAGTVITNQDSVEYTDDDDDTTNDFSFELNDFPNSSKDETNPAPPPLPLPPPMITIRAPTSADVAYRALIKARTGGNAGRNSQPIKAQSPLAKPQVTRLSVPARTLRSSTRRLSTEKNASTIQPSSPPPPETNNITNQSVNDNNDDDDEPPIELVEVISLSEDEDNQNEPNDGITLNLTTSAEEADRSASSTCSSSLSTVQDLATPTDPKRPVLSREFTYNTPTTRSSTRRRSILINLPSQPFIPEEEPLSLSTSKSMLSPLSTNPTVISEAPPIILQKSLAGSASPSPNPTPTITIRQSTEYLSPRRNINPLHSSTPSNRNKSLEIVSIGEQEQVSTTVPQPLTIEEISSSSSSSSSHESIQMIDNEQQTDIPIRIQHVIDESIQTSPEKPPVRLGIDIGIQTSPLIQRCFQTIEQQTTPIVTRSSTSSSSCQTTPVVFKKPELTTQEQITPLHSKTMIHLRRNVRFQFTPSTDARLTAKEKLEEEQRQLKQQQPPQMEIHIPTDNEREDDTEDEIKTKPKKKVTKKIHQPSVSTNDDSSEEINESPVRRTTRKQTKNETDVTSTTHSKKKTSKRSKVAQPPLPLEPEPEPEPEIVVTTTSPPLPTKRTNRKRPNPKTSNVSPPETTTSPTEPVTKRPKTTEVKQPVPDNSTLSNKTKEPSPEPPSTRHRSKPTSLEPVERPPPIPKKSKKTSVENNKRKNSVPTIKNGKRRLHSVEQDEGLNTADEEETIQTILLQPPPPSSVELSQEEKEKIEGLTVVELKNRLNTHGENIPKGARKADLVALVIKIETNLLKERKEAETVVAVPENPPSRKTRRKKT